MRAIGLSNFNSVQVLEILEKGKVKPANLQVGPAPGGGGHFHAAPLFLALRSTNERVRGTIMEATSPLTSFSRRPACAVLRSTNGIATGAWKRRHRPRLSQVECHPYFSQEPLFAFCKERGISLTAYSPLGTGAEIDGGTRRGPCQHFPSSDSRLHGASL